MSAVDLPLGKHVPLRHLASGGMAEIHLALTRGIEGFEKLIIVKRILPTLVTDADFVRMFLDEARVAATLHHPNIVQVYDIGRDEQSHFFTMEFVYGADLSLVLRRAADARTPPPLDQALSIILALCGALHYAHGKEGMDGKSLGLVHRDVSPQNVLISFDGVIKLTDFGIAKAAARAGATQTGALKGKLAYMSPEQVRAKPLDRRSDIFALSILLWELTTFRRLFRAASAFDTLEMITSTDAPPPSQFRPDYPPELEAIVMKGLQRDPGLRYQTAEQMQLDLEELARELRLQISSVHLGRFMNGLFRDQSEAWTKAQAEGMSFPKFLTTCDLPSPSTHTDTWVAPPSEEIARDLAATGHATPLPFAIPPLFPVEARLRVSGAMQALPRPEPPALDRRRAWPLVAGGVALAGAVALVLASRGSDKDTAAATAPTPTPQASGVIDAAAPDAAVPDAAVAVQVIVDAPAGDAATTPPPAGAADAAAARKDTSTPAKGSAPARPPKPVMPPPKPPEPPDNGLDDLLPR